MRKVLLAAASLLALCGTAHAQLPPSIYTPPGPSVANPSYQAGDGVLIMRNGTAYKTGNLMPFLSTSDFATALVTTITGTSAQTLSTLFSQMEIFPDWFKQTADGNDDAPSIQRAMNAVCAAHLSRTIGLEARTYEIDSAVSAPCPLTIEGQGMGTVPTEYGTWFHIGGTSFTPFTFPAAARGSNIEKLGFSQDMPADTGPSWTPTVYPYVVNCQSGNVNMNWIMFNPVYDGVNLTTCARNTLNNIYGQVMDTGFLLDQSFDVNHIGTIHFWPFYSPASPDILNYTQQHAIAFLLKRVDGFFADSIFTFAMKSAVQVDEQLSTSNGYQTGALTIGDIKELHAEMSLYPLWVTGSSAADGLEPDLHIGYFNVDESQWGSNAAVSGGTSINIDSSGQIQLAIDRFKSNNAENSAVEINNGSLPSVLTIGHFYATRFDSHANGTSAIFATNTLTNPPHKISIATLPILESAGETNPPILNATNAIVTMPLYPTAVYAATSGSTYAITNGTQNAYMSSGSTLATLTLTLPPNPPDGWPVNITFGSAVTSLTVNANTGQAMDGATATAATADQTLRYIWSVGAAAWIRQQ
jgi:hypothetical protein